MKVGEMLSEMDVENIPQVLDLLRAHAKGTLDQVIVENSTFAAEVGDQGRVTIPSAERRKQGIEKGDLVQVFVRKIDEKEED